MAIYAKVRRMRLRDGLSITEIAGRTSLSRNTITAWLRGPVRSEMTNGRPAGPRKIGAYATILQDALEADARRPRRERRTVRKLYAQLQAQTPEPDDDAAVLTPEPGVTRRERSSCSSGARGSGRRRQSGDASGDRRLSCQKEQSSWLGGRDSNTQWFRSVTH
jgi:transcriptional regulator with XRE-family HTH domain